MMMPAWQRDPPQKPLPRPLQLLSAPRVSAANNDDNNNNNNNNHHNNNNNNNNNNK